MECCSGISGRFEIFAGSCERHLHPRKHLLPTCLCGVRKRERFIDGRLKCTYTPLKVFSYSAGFFNHFRYTGEASVYAALPEEPLPMMHGWSVRTRGRLHCTLTSDMGWGQWPFSEDSEAYFFFFGGFFGGCFLTIYRKTDFFAFFGGLSISNFQIIYIYIIKSDINFDSNQHFSRLVLICLHERQSLVLLCFFCFCWSWFSLNTTFAL